MESQKIGELWIIWKNAYKYSVQEEKQASKDILELIKELVDVKVAALVISQPVVLYQFAQRVVLQEYCIPESDWKEFFKPMMVIEGGRNDGEK